MNRLALAGSIAASSAFGGHSAGDDDMRRGLSGWGNCYGPCENDSERTDFSVWDLRTWDNPCTCKAGSKWEGPCCDTRTECDGSFVCPRYLIQETSVSVDDLEVDGVWQDIGPRVANGDNIPENLKGIFWLTYQADSSALLTFAQSPNEDNAALEDDDDVLAIRVAGDRTWAFADDAAPWGLVDQADLVYHFKHGGNGPKFGGDFYDIIPESRRVGVSMPDQVLNFDMEEMTEQQVIDHPLNPCDDMETEEVEGCTNSVVWDRTSSIVFWDVTSKEYLLTQVVDQYGNVIEPAWSMFKQQQKSAEVGDSPGFVHYRYV